MVIAAALKGIKDKTIQAIKENKIVLLLTLFIVGLITITIVFMQTKHLSFLKDYNFIVVSVLCVALFAGLMFMLHKEAEPVEAMKKPNFGKYMVFYLKYLGVMALGIGVISGILYLFTSSTLTSIASLYIILFLSLSIGLYLVHSLFKQTSLYKDLAKSQLFSMLYHAIFLLPCMIVDGGRSLYKDVKHTKSYVYYLLLIEVVLIALYFGIPYVYKKIEQHDSHILLEKPIYLNHEKTLGTFENLKTTADKDFEYKYGISLWCYINQTTPSTANSSTSDAVIFNYGNKPRITYNVKENTLKVFARAGVDKEVIVYKTDTFKQQKWNNIIINFNSSTMDVFINGSLVGTSDNILPYMTYDDVIAGMEGGLHGGIKKVYYSNEPYSLTQIKMMQ